MFESQETKNKMSPYEVVQSKTRTDNDSSLNIE